MTANYDVMLNGAGYMLVPPPEAVRATGTGGANYRLDVIPFKPAVVRTGIRDWALPLSPHDETRWRADSLLPELSGYGTVRGLVLGPAVRALPVATYQISAVAVFAGSLYFSVGTTLAAITLTSGAVGSYRTVGIAAGAITGMWVSTGRLYLALASPATSYASTDGATIVNAPGTVVGALGFGYASGTWMVSRNTASTLAASIDGGATWTYWQVEAAIRSVLTTGRAALIFHAAGVDELTGSWTTSGSVTTANFTLTPLVHTTGAGTSGDYAWAADYNGHLYTWFGGTVCVLERSTITGGRLVALDGAPRGSAVAAVVAAGRLWVAVITSQYELWSSDGVRWVRHAIGVPVALLGSLAGIASDVDVLLFPAGGGALTTQGLLTQALGHTAYPAANGNVVCGPWDAGKPDDAKTWTEIEVGWGVPERAPLPSGTLFVETSVNGGGTYSAAGGTVITSGTGGTIRQALSGVSGATLMVRVTWTPTANGVGLRIFSIYANGWEISAAPAVMRWQLRVRCSDKLLNRLGNVDARSGEAMRATLIALAKSGGPVAYQDYDYDANAVSQTVRVVEIDEASRRGDGTHFWESEVNVTLEAIT